MKKIDVAVIGAGLLGCFAARALSAWQLETAVFEKREDVCTGISRANTGVIYAGYDTKPNTLKTALCVRANARFEALCRELDVSFHRCGSVMVSTGPKADAVLRRKYAQGLENGVPGLRLLDRKAVLECEPRLSSRVSSGLYAPGTGTIHPWELCIAAFENAQQNGTAFHFNEEVLHIARGRQGFQIATSQDCYQARAVLNCAGLAADRVREWVERPKIRLVPTAGEYLVLDDTVGQFLRHIVFYEPEENQKGLTFVPTVDGNLLIGATERPWYGAAPFASDKAKLEWLCAQSREVIPALPLDQLIRSFGALRPNPYAVRRTGSIYVREEKSISTFVLLEEQGLYSMLGIKTPGLTCAAELGRWMSKKIVRDLDCQERNPNYTPYRKRIPAVRSLPEAQWRALVQAQPDYGQIVCRCKNISKGEILEAIRRGAVTVDGVKKRTGALLGRCQGGRCMQTVLELLAKAQDVPVERICKDGGQSQVLYEKGHETI